MGAPLYWPTVILLQPIIVKKCIKGVYASGAVGNCIPSLDFNLCRAKVMYCNVNRNSQVLSLGGITVV